MTAATLAAPARAELIAKHSRFLAQAWPIDGADAAQALLGEVRRVEATHHCWAWRLGTGYRSSDDGEPAGSAGRPILAAVDGQGLDRVLVVVTRWYGGINLGVGGLVRAYGGCAAECLRTASRRVLVPMARLEVGFDHPDTGAVRAALDAPGLHAHPPDFTHDGARIAVELPADALDALKARLRDATRNRARLRDLPAPPDPR